MQSILEILLINDKPYTSKKNGTTGVISEAHCVLRNEDGTPGAVGVLIIPKVLRDICKPGQFTASFALQAAAYGEQQGRIVATLINLLPIAPKSFKPAL